MCNVNIVVNKENIIYNIIQQLFNFLVSVKNAFDYKLIFSLLINNSCNVSPRLMIVFRFTLMMSMISSSSF